MLASLAGSILIASARQGLGVMRQSALAPAKAPRNRGPRWTLRPSRVKVAPRRRMRVSLRVMMLAILCLAIFLGWQVNKARQQREAVAAVRRHGGWVHYDYQMVDDKPVPGKQPWGPRWLRRALGDEYFQTVVSVNLYFDESDGSTPQNGDTRPCDDVLAFLATQHGLKSLNMLGSQATDAGLAYLRNATTLERLLLQDESIISDSGVATFGTSSISRPSASPNRTSLMKDSSPCPS